MNTGSSGNSAICARVERTLAINRKAKLNFPGVFMDVIGHELDEDRIRLQFYDDPLFREGRGEVSWVAVGVLADLALGGVTRPRGGPRVRPATVHIALQMSGAPVRGDLAADARFLMFSERTQARQALSTATISAGDTVLGSCSGAFVMLDLPPGSEQFTRPWLPPGVTDEPLGPVEFDENERRALEACRHAERVATPRHPFVEHFWCGIPVTRRDRADLDIEVTPHLGNRIGHVHGGVLFGAVASVAGAATRPDMRLSNLSAYFLAPGLPPRLHVRAEVVQQGRSIAVVRSSVTRADGKLVLEATSQHVAAA
jgi:acyl-coenzyme A thioesterase PaaI-like protein